MEVTSAHFVDLNTNCLFSICNSFSSPLSRKTFCHFPQNSRFKSRIALTFIRSSNNSPTLSCFSVSGAIEAISELPTVRKGGFHKFDKSGRFSSPRAARELALLIVYASCLQGSDPVSLFDKRLNDKRMLGYAFDKALLSQYDHMRFAGKPAGMENKEQVDELRKKEETDLEFEAQVLSAPPKLVYNNFVLGLARNLLKVVAIQWNEHSFSIEKISPKKWKEEPSARILEYCILRLAMAEITGLGTPYQIVINEAVDLSKRFCDGFARPVINGCLQNFVTNILRADTCPMTVIQSKVEIGK